MTIQDRLLEMMQETGALLSGHFLLTSGLHSGNYMQCAQLLRVPRYAAFAGEQIAAVVRDLKPQMIVAPALGGLIIGHEVARALDVPFLFCERQEGKMRLRRFAHPGNVRILAVEDVVTTGGSVREVGELLQEEGAEWVGTACVVDRSGGKNTLPHTPVSLMQVNFPVYEASVCPLCVQGLPLVKPGSR